MLASVVDFVLPVVPPFLCFWVFNLVCYMASPSPTHSDDMKYTFVQHPSDFARTLTRWWILDSLVQRDQYWPLLVLIPLTIFETAICQYLYYRHEHVPTPDVTVQQILNCCRTSIVETCGVILSLKVIPGVFAEIVPHSQKVHPLLSIICAKFSKPVVHAPPPTFVEVLQLLYLCPLFDLGLDLGFYTFHLTSHRNKYLFKMIHADHHTDTAKTHGRLVSYETYTITWLETAIIFFCYTLGLGFCLLAQTPTFAPLTVFQLAALITWGHTVELSGHTSSTWTPSCHPQRVIFQILKLDLRVQHHTMHHERPLTNFSKRTTLYDRLFGTYKKPNDLAY